MCPSLISQAQHTNPHPLLSLKDLMDIDETPDFALIGLQRVRDLAGSLGGASRKFKLCGQLAAELLIIEYELEHAELDSEEQLPNTWKLLRDVERICSVSTSLK